MQQRAVLGVVRRVAAHPNADKLRLCEVDVGAKEALQIVCGAPNVREGLRVAVARVGTQLEVPELKSEAAEPLKWSKMKLKKSKIRGEASNGMMCSLHELGFTSQTEDLHAGIWEIQGEVVADAQPGSPIGDDWPQRCIADAVSVQDARAPLTSLEKHWDTAGALSEAGALLQWDRSTMMPAAAAPARARQQSVLTRVVHEMNTSAEYDGLLQEARSPTVQANLNAFEKRSVELATRELALNKAISSETVAQRAKLQAETLTRWEKARELGKWKIVEPVFADLLEISRDIARDQAAVLAQVAPDTAPKGAYGALVQEYVMDIDEDGIADIFATLKKRLSPLVQGAEAAAPSPALDASASGTAFEIAKQKEFSNAVLKSVFGKELAKTRLDESVHPFSIGISDGDVRITTRYNPDNLREGLMGSMHEAGHALYELGAPARGWPAGTFLDIATHESQSLFLERMIGQSRPFCKWIQGRYAQTFGYGRLDQDQRAGLEDLLLAGLNARSDTFVRVDADELAYPLHVIARFELERSLFDGSLAVKDLPQAWIDTHAELLGRAPPADDGKKNVLQDTHWYAGYFGYFPSYTIGAMAAHQLFTTMQGDLGADNVSGLIEKGNFEPIVGWLRENVHAHGRMDSGVQGLLKRVTGRTLDANAYCDYLEQKYSS
ncbi:Phenylalanine--tRNA ligase beta subunit [Hondaea fermentalgiana]|uniref:Phenylalanine--tRNA ligase beta subunit n=1 Tax=Hondaea fermentalgiana TaxID=2315210 RepID=A0A2R5G9D0_9STRA|nr:Phenylalanine--tRNA ligase beta subunit [Hondaea fermentalgiana]|eukprot:GBG24671.1 Phenylalanine--tRNA ligase beta subunit [Hondaea fermentalgiana]